MFSADVLIVFICISSAGYRCYVMMMMMMVSDQVMLLAAWLSADARRRQCTVAVSLMTICLSDLVRD